MPKRKIGGREGDETNRSGSPPKGQDSRDRLGADASSILHAAQAFGEFSDRLFQDGVRTSSFHAKASATSANWKGLLASKNQSWSAPGKRSPFVQTGSV